VIPNYPRRRRPAAARRPTPTTRGRPGAPRRTSAAAPAEPRASRKMVIIHTCEGAYSGCWGWLVKKESGVSAHYVVKEDGSEISQLVQGVRQGLAHRRQVQEALNGGKECRARGLSGNNFTVGIEHAGFGKQAAWNANLIAAVGQAGVRHHQAATTSRATSTTSSATASCSRTTAATRARTGRGRPTSRRSTPPATTRSRRSRRPRCRPRTTRSRTTAWTPRARPATPRPAIRPMRRPAIPPTIRPSIRRPTPRRSSSTASTPTTR
jgi:hypothetical protein